MILFPFTFKTRKLFFFIKPVKSIFFFRGGGGGGGHSNRLQNTKLRIAIKFSFQILFSKHIG